MKKKKNKIAKIIFDPMSQNKIKSRYFSKLEDKTAVEEGASNP
ncbi:MAG: hypothetical protein ACOC5T_09155 [Elusimicrobiota bacterium]